jgi:ABC-type transport system involved in cytochrome c biogenesis permease subunit
VISNEALLSASSGLLLVAFVGYLAATLLYISGFIGNRISHGERFGRNANWAGNAMIMAIIGHAGAILTRWQGAGHWPTSNMYEFIGFMAFTSMLAFVIINRMYRIPVLGALVAPVGVSLMAYSYVFPPAVQPLVPALKSYWLPLHVSMAALGEGFFAVAFGAALLYLLRVRGLELTARKKGGEVAATAPTADHKIHFRREDAWDRVWGPKAMEGLFYLILVMVGFTLLALGLRYSGFVWVFDTATYHLPPLIGPVGEGVATKDPLFGLIPMPLFEAPIWMRGKHMNSLLYSLGLGGLLYWSIRRFITKGPIGDYLAVRVSGNPEVLDEVSYRAVAIGYPIFTLGGLIFAMLWAKEAWGRYWFWDPKETWAFIAWLVYSAYLHFRITRGWEGRKSAWLAVLGFGVILFTLIGVNLLIVGLHSYAGGD